MNAKLVLITVLFAALLLLTSCSLLTGGAVANDACSSLEGSAKDNCYFESNQCSKIKNTQFRDSCVAELAKQKNDVKVCDLIVTGRTIGFCQHQIALQQQDFELCKEIGDEFWHDTCVYQLALETKDSDKCSHLADVEQNLDCVKKVAIASHDVELCDHLSRQNKAQCIFSIATETLNADLCTRFVDDKLSAASCYLKIAKLSDDKALCNKIPIKDIKGMCMDHFAEKAAALSS